MSFPSESTDTVATHEIRQKHQHKILGAEPQLITIEAIAETLVLMAGSTAFDQDDGIQRSMVFLAGTLMDESQKLRKRLYE
jgi:hypothetical protein